MNGIQNLLDTHCHLGQFDDPVDVLRLSKESAVDIVAVTSDPGEYRLLKTRLGRRPGVDVALGIHPLRATSLTKDDMSRFFRLMPQAHWIGEVGLDFSRADAVERRKQLDVFDSVLAESRPQSHPLTVHSRGAEVETIRHLEYANLRAILHWYSGPIGLVEAALSAGLYFSINAAMMRSRKTTSLLAIVPIERLLIESDGPYARFGGRPSRPSDADWTVRQIARQLNMESVDVTEAIVRNQADFLAPPSMRGTEIQDLRLL
jgi:TatD DNase family protein